MTNLGLLFIPVDTYSILCPDCLYMNTMTVNCFIYYRGLKSIALDTIVISKTTMLALKGLTSIQLSFSLISVAKRY